MIKWSVLLLVLLNLIFWGYTHLVEESSVPREVPAVTSLPTLTIAPPIKKDSAPCVTAIDATATPSAPIGETPCRSTPVAVPAVAEPSVAQP